MKLLLLLFLIPINSFAKCYVMVWAGDMDLKTIKIRSDQLVKDAKSKGCESKLFHDTSLLNLSKEVKTWTKGFKSEDKFHISLTDHGTASDLLIMGSEDGKKYTYESYPTFFEKVVPKKAKQITYDSSICFPAFGKFLHEDIKNHDRFKNEEICEYSSLPKEECERLKFKKVSKPICGAHSVSAGFKTTTSPEVSLNNHFANAAWNKLPEKSLFSNSPRRVQDLWQIGNQSDFMNSLKWSRLSSLSYIDLYSSQEICNPEYKSKCKKITVNKKHKKMDDLEALITNISKSPKADLIDKIESKIIQYANKGTHNSKSQDIINCESKILLDSKLKQIQDYFNQIEKIINKKDLEKKMASIPKEFMELKEQYYSAKDFFDSPSKLLKIKQNISQSYDNHMKVIKKSYKKVPELIKDHQQLIESNFDRTAIRDFEKKYEPFIDYYNLSFLTSPEYSTDPNNKQKKHLSEEKIRRMLTSSISKSWDTNNIKKAILPLVNASKTYEDIQTLSHFFSSSDVSNEKKVIAVNIRKCELKDIY